MEYLKHQLLEFIKDLNINDKVFCFEKLDLENRFPDPRVCCSVYIFNYSPCPAPPIIEQALD